MTEEDTFIKLKGLTYDECVEMYTSHYLHYVSTHKYQTHDDVWNYVDTILKPYGWSCRLMDDYGNRSGRLINK